MQGNSEIIINKYCHLNRDFYYLFYIILFYLNAKYSFKLLSANFPPLLSNKGRWGLEIVATGGWDGACVNEGVCLCVCNGSSYHQSQCFFSLTSHFITLSLSSPVLILSQCSVFLSLAPGFILSSISPCIHVLISVLPLSCIYHRMSL